MFLVDVRVRSPLVPDPVISVRVGLPDQVAAPTPLVMRTWPTDPVPKGKLVDPIAMAVDADRMMLRDEKSVRSLEAPDPVTRGVVIDPKMVGLV